MKEQEQKFNMQQPKIQQKVIPFLKNENAGTYFMFDSKSTEKQRFSFRDNEGSSFGLSLEGSTKEHDYLHSCVNDIINAFGKIQGHESLIFISTYCYRLYHQYDNDPLISEFLAIKKGWDIFAFLHSKFYEHLKQNDNYSLKIVAHESKAHTSADFKLIKKKFTELEKAYTGYKNYKELLLNEPNKEDYENRLNGCAQKATYEGNLKSFIKLLETLKLEFSDNVNSNKASVVFIEFLMNLPCYNDIKDAYCQYLLQHDANNNHILANAKASIMQSKIKKNMSFNQEFLDAEAPVFFALSHLNKKSTIYIKGSVESEILYGALANVSHYAQNVKDLTSLTNIPCFVEKEFEKAAKKTINNRYGLYTAGASTISKYEPLSSQNSDSNRKSSPRKLGYEDLEYIHDALISDAADIKFYCNNIASYIHTYTQAALKEKNIYKLDCILYEVVKNLTIATLTKFHSSDDEFAECISTLIEKALAIKDSESDKQLNEGFLEQLTETVLHGLLTGIITAGLQQDNVSRISIMVSKFFSKFCSETFVKKAEKNSFKDAKIPSEFLLIFSKSLEELEIKQEFKSILKREVFSIVVKHNTMQAKHNTANATHNAVSSICYNVLS